MNSGGLDGGGGWMSEVQYVPISQLKLPEDYIRFTCNDDVVRKIARDIEQGLGIQTPLLVRRRGDKYEIIDGVHRYIAAQKVGLERLPCIEVIAGDVEALILAYRVNSERRNVGAKEKLKVAWLLLNKYAKSLDEVKAELNLTRVDVHRLRMLSERLSDEQQQKWLKGELSLRDALRLAGSPVEGRKKTIVSRETMRLSNVKAKIFMSEGNVEELVNVLCTVLDGVPMVERGESSVIISTDTCRIYVYPPKKKEREGEGE